MNPILVTAHLAGGVSLPSGPLALDALLMAAVAMRDALPPIDLGPRIELEIPIAKEAGGRFHLASFSVAPRWDLHERRFVQRRFPIPEAQVIGDSKLRRIDISAGAQKSYRLPGVLSHPAGDSLVWYAIGDAAGVRDLLVYVTHLGKRRAVGRGRVARWDVSQCEPWGDGFPVVREGRALRTLPEDWPGLSEPTVGWRVLSPPYWDHVREERCAVVEATW